jgi:S1-C subfamily serine protease
MKKMLAILVASLMMIMSAAGCCSGLANLKNETLGVLPNPNDFVKSTVMLSVPGVATATIGKEVMTKPTAISASGVAIDKKHILTAAHFCIPVLQGQSEKGLVEGIVKVTFEKDMKMTYLNNNEENVVVGGVKIIATDKERDLCIVELKHHGIVPAKIAKPSTIHRGDKVYIVGAPLGLFPVKTEGEVAIPVLAFDDKEAMHINGRILVTAPATSGNSGGPAFNEKGEVIGVVMAGSEPYDHLIILTPSKYILAFLKAKHKD